MKEAIMAIRAGRRRETAEILQRALTSHGCSIKMRLGLHEAGEYCSDEGLILLQLVGQEEEFTALKADLDQIPELRYNMMDI